MSVDSPGSRHVLTAGRWPVLTALCLLWPSAAQAQTVYRCGPAGNVYSQVPCADGRAIDVSDTRSPAEAAEARKALGAQERWARQAARDREREERANPPALAGGIGPGKAAAAHGDDKAEPSSRKGKGKTTSAKASPSKHKDFVAFVPGSGKKAK